MSPLQPSAHEPSGSRRPEHSLRMATASSIPPSTASFFWKTWTVTCGWWPSASSTSLEKVK